VAAVCADGSTSSPSLIYSSTNSTLQASWVGGIEAEKHKLFLSSTLSGWTNNDVDLAWLEQVFRRQTKEKARWQRNWRLLILDGHSSHLTMDFIDYCCANSILLAIFPPHNTQTLQPLGVVCFKPLSSNYSALTNHLYKMQELLVVQKGYFFPLFWSAWQSFFTTDIVRKSFKATSIWPMDLSVIVAVYAVKQKVMCVFLLCFSVVAMTLIAAALVCLHDVSLMYTCVKSAHGLERGALGQCAWHT
jgi:hypothetical protein